jgi:2-haloacid dehalogenase
MTARAEKVSRNGLSQTRIRRHRRWSRPRPPPDHHVIRVIKMIAVGVSEPGQGVAVIRGPVAEDIELLELCGGLGLVWTARIIETIDMRIPVGSVGYGPESIDAMSALFQGVTASACRGHWHGGHTGDGEESPDRVGPTALHRDCRRRGRVMRTRREFLSLVGVAAASVWAQAGSARGKARIKAVALDAFTTFDPRPVFALAERLFPGKGAELSAVWRARQFEYTWLRALMGRYADFWTVTEEALVFAARMAHVDLTPERRGQLMDAYFHLNAYPDALSALTSLTHAGVRVGFLTNMTPRMLDAAIANAGLGGLVDQRLSTDRIRTYKPDPRAYQMGIDAFGLALEEIAFAAFGAWDAAGAKAFGYTTFWVNRLDQPVEELGVNPDGFGVGLGDLVSFLRPRL